MNPLVMTGTLSVHLALIFYTTGFITEQRKKRISGAVLFFITVGVLFDIIATFFMIAGSSANGITVHGALGYSALTLMLIDCIRFWSIRRRYGRNAEVGRGLHNFTRVAYYWWIGAFITGGILVALRP